MAFSTTLSAALGAADLVASVATNVGARTTYPWRATIGSEIIYVVSGVAEGLDWGIIRGTNDTDPVDHAVGSKLNAAAQTAMVFVGAADPGPVGTGNIWLDTALYPRWWVRNAGDSGWDVAGTISPLTSLALTVSNPPTQVQVQAIADKVDALLALMRTGGLLT